MKITENGDPLSHEKYQTEIKIVQTDHELPFKQKISLRSP